MEILRKYGNAVFVMNWFINDRVAGSEGSKFHTQTHFPQKCTKVSKQKLVSPKFSQIFNIFAPQEKKKAQFIILSKIWIKNDGKEKNTKKKNGEIPYNFV